MNIEISTYDDLKSHYDKVLNTDKSTFKSSNDEPTPIGCIEEMYSHIPADVWERPDLKILDPCCGNGNFHLVSYFNLINRLDTQSILEDVLYFNDINEERLNNVKNIFGQQHNLNLSSKDFMSNPTFDIHFDLVVANPPYAKLLENGKRASKNHNLIKVFLKNAFRLLKPNGFLVFITPDNWMSLADRNDVAALLTSQQIHHLDIHSAKRYFKKIGSSFTWYVVEKCAPFKDINISGIYKGRMFCSSVSSRVRDYIPLLYTKEVQSILSKTVDAQLPCFKVETSSDLHKFTKKDLIRSTADDVYAYKLIHTPSQTVYASRPHKFQEGYKVFISTTDKYKLFIDACGMTQSIAFIRCKDLEEAEEIKTVLSHPMYEFINNICRWGNFNNVRILQRLPIPQKKDYIYGSFSISESEQEFIESYL